MVGVYAPYVSADSAEIRLRILKILNIQFPPQPTFLHLPPKIPTTPRSRNPLTISSLPKNNNKIPVDDES